MVFVEHCSFFTDMHLNFIYYQITCLNINLHGGVDLLLFPSMYLLNPFGGSRIQHKSNI